ncbi:holo-[acyl-carrier-protein] synthase [Candidatus Pacearchaeota archaeon]|nr:holo-[acyl-carrier-protein] synthase [Candidatus Pacearchaeota archaeon]
MVMKTKIGIDIVYIPRFKALMQNKSFINKVFHASEIQDYRPEHLAGIFAAKEAFFKSLDKKTLDWLAVEIKNKKNKKPKLLVSSELRNKAKIKDIDLSISHDKDYAIASVMVLLK